MVDLVHFLANLLFFDVPLLYYYINLKSLSIITLLHWSSIFFFLLEIHIFLLVFLYQIVYFLFHFQLSLNYSAVKSLRLSWFNGNFITNHIRKCFSCFCDCSLEAVLNASAADYLAWSRLFWLYLLLKFTYIFSKKQESIVIYKYSVSWLKIWQIWKYENSELKVFKNIKFLGEISSK